MKFKDLIEEILSEEVLKFAIDGYKFEVLDNEGNIPHIHFYKGFEKHPDVDGCILLTTVGYFKHDTHTDELPKKIYKKFVKELKKDGNKKFKDLCNEWNYRNPKSKQIEKDQINPYQ